MDAGEILADNVKKCIGYIRENCPDAEIYVWGDMFDPTHNAHKDYYFVRGDLTGSWKGLDKNIIPVPWDVENAEKSTKWFESLGMRMVVSGCIDSPVEKLFPWIKAAKETKGVEAIMYTTWTGRFNNLAKFAGELRKEYDAPAKSAPVK